MSTNELSIKALLNQAPVRHSVLPYSQEAVAVRPALVFNKKGSGAGSRYGFK
jgi:hypothetical protein